MTAQTTDTSVTTSIVVEAPIEKAFTVFTDDIGSWWTPEHHILQAELKEMVFEPRVGGRIIDRGVDGSEVPGPACSPTSRPTGSSSVGTSACSGSSRPTLPHQRGRGALRRRGPVAHPGRARAPPPRPARRRLGADARRGRSPRRLGRRPRRFAARMAS